MAKSKQHPCKHPATSVKPNSLEDDSIFWCKKCSQHINRNGEVVKLIELSWDTLSAPVK